jgi:hypothetical protein
MIKKFEPFSNNKITKNFVIDLMDRFVDLEKYDPIINVGFWEIGYKERFYTQTYYDIKTDDIPHFDAVEEYFSKKENLRLCIEWQITVKSDLDRIDDIRLFDIMKEFSDTLSSCGHGYSFNFKVGSSNFGNNIQILYFRLFKE